LDNKTGVSNTRIDNTLCEGIGGAWMKYNEFDVVKVVAKKYDGIEVGAVGTIVIAFNTPNEAYEVEFLDEFGTTKSQKVFLPDEIEKV
jgi:hypothetical protein